MGIESKTPYYHFEVDNLIFSSEEELIEHIRINYAKEVSTEVVNRIHAIERELKFAFPGWNVHIKKASQGGIFAVTLSKASLKFTLKYTKENGKSAHGIFTTIPELSQAFQSKITTVESILNSATNIKSMKHFSFTSYISGFSEEEEAFEFSFLNRNANLGNIYFYPDEQPLQSFCAIIERFDTSVLEGEVKTQFNQFQQVEDITVEGFSLKYLEMLGKHVKIEVRD